jgi:hypothetical protein
VRGEAITLVCVQVCQGNAELSRVDAGDDGLPGLAARVASVLRLYAPDDATRGTAYTLYAMDAEDRRYAGPYPIRVYPRDLNDDEGGDTILARPGQAKAGGEPLGTSQGDAVLRAVCEYQSQQVAARDRTVLALHSSVVALVESVQGAVAAIAGQYEVALRSVQASAERADARADKADDRTDRAMVLVDKLTVRVEELERDLERAEKGTDVLVEMAGEAMREFKRGRPGAPNGHANGSAPKGDAE